MQEISGVVVGVSVRSNEHGVHAAVQLVVCLHAANAHFVTTTCERSAILSTETFQK